MAFKDYKTSSEVRDYLLRVLSRTGNRKQDLAQLYHYTSIETVAAIVGGGNIFLGSTDNMNDYFEGEIIKEVKGANTQFFTCFSRAEENLAMYKMYAPSPNGAMITISFSDAARIIESLPKDENGKYSIPIVRDNKVTEDYVSAEIYWCAVAYKDLHTDLIRAGEAINAQIDKPFDQEELVGFLKLYGWEYEKEVRLCAKLDNALEHGEKVAISIPRTVHIKVVTGPGFDTTKYRSQVATIKRKSIEVHSSEYDAFVDLGYTELEEMSRLRKNSLEKDTIIANQTAEIQRLKDELANRFDDEDIADLFLQNEKIIQSLNQKLDILARFSHVVSDQVKKLTAEIRTMFDDRIVQRITNFLQESINSLEEILSRHFDTDVRASIKLNNGLTTVRTFVRGTHNKASRGGDYRCQELDLRTIEVEENYAYIAIISRGEQFFASGDLLDLKNKYEPDDVFFCEYGDDYYESFIATIVMPIRIPRFDGEKEQEILGVLCVDTKKEIPEWSDGYEMVKKTRAYHIIADYVDSLAILFKEYYDAEEN